MYVLCGRFQLLGRDELQYVRYMPDFGIWRLKWGAAIGGWEVELGKSEG